MYFFKIHYKIYHGSKDNLCCQRPWEKERNLSYICLHEIKDKQLSIIYFGILYDPKILFT